MLRRRDVLMRCPECDGEGHTMTRGYLKPCPLCGMHGEILTEAGRAIAEVMRLTCPLMCNEDRKRR